MKRITVFCGSSSGTNPEYLRAAKSLGALFVERGIGLVYGGGNVGLMGAIADAVLAKGGEVIGVIPGGLVAREVAHRGVTELRVVETMHERKSIMSELADGFIAMPGGFGTLEEIAEVLTWGQLGMHKKPCAFLNVAGYYDALLAFFDRAVKDGLLRREHRAVAIVGVEPGALLDAMERFEAPDLPKWLDRDKA